MGRCYGAVSINALRPHVHLPRPRDLSSKSSSATQLSPCSGGGCGSLSRGGHGLDSIPDTSPSRHIRCSQSVNASLGLSTGDGSMSYRAWLRGRLSRWFASISGKRTRAGFGNGPSLPYRNRFPTRAHHSTPLNWSRSGCRGSSCHERPVARVGTSVLGGS